VKNLQYKINLVINTDLQYVICELIGIDPGLSWMDNGRHNGRRHVKADSDNRTTNLQPRS